MCAFERKHIRATVISLAMVVFTVAWYYGVHEFRVTNRQSKDGWSETPLLWMFILVFAPLFSLVGIPMLLHVEDRLTALDVCAILVACSPVLVLIITALFAFLPG